MRQISGESAPTYSTVKWLAEFKLDILAMTQVTGDDVDLKRLTERPTTTIFPQRYPCFEEKQVAVV